MYGIEALLTGHTLGGRYRVEGVIGRGGMGAVYRASDERLGRAVAVKVISAIAPDAAAHARLRARFHREARAAAALHHPNVIAVYDYGTDAALDIDFLVMELLQGEDLAARLARVGPPPLEATLALLHGAALGLAAGHRAGLIHRDVKPGNLYLVAGEDSAPGRVRVLDFGIAEIAADDATLTHLTVAGRSPFSPAYASPEQLGGESRLTPATDVFSLAAVGYHLLMGERPFTSPDPERARVELSAALHALRTRANLLPQRTAVTLARALAHTPDERFADAGAFAAAFAGTAPPSIAAPDPARAAPAAARRPAPAPPPPAEPEADHTRFLTGSIGPAAEPVPGAPPAPPAARPKRGWLRRTASAVLAFCITAAVASAWVGVWALAVDGVQTRDRMQMLVGIGASALLAPLLVHRITGRRGYLVAMFFGSIAITYGATSLVGPDTRDYTLIALTFWAQLLASVGLGRLTRRAESPPEVIATRVEAER
jgi:hypothetical protein